MLSQLIVLLAAIAIIILIIGWIFKIIKLSITTALTIFVLILILKFAFNIDSQTIWQTILNLPQILQETLKN